jgi:hypothetical protein
MTATRSNIASAGTVGKNLTGKERAKMDAFKMKILTVGISSSTVHEYLPVCISGMVKHLL